MSAKPFSSSQIVAFPLIDSQFMDENGSLTKPWYQFLRNLWMRVGGAIANVVLGTINSNGSITATVGNSTTVLVGGTLDITGENVIITTPVEGQPAVEQVLGASPFTFTAGFQGILLIESGQVQFSRGLFGPMTVGLAGGAISVLVADIVTVTWFNSVPKVVFLPGGS